VVVGCILTQNTNWLNVEKAISNLKEAHLLTPSALADLAIDQFPPFIKPTGFFSQKPARLKRISEWWLATVGEATAPLRTFHYRHNDQSGTINVADEALAAATTTELRTLLLKLNGVGPETADAILLYGLGRPVFVVDAYTRRVLSRLGLVEKRVNYHDLQALFMDELPPDVPLFNDFHAQIVELAKRHCLTRPRCEGCPLEDKCEYPKNYL
jgi:endonuclease-3 related protein